MSKKDAQPETPPPPPPAPKEAEDSDDVKQWDKVVYNVAFDLMKGITLGALATLLFTSKKAAFASGVGFGAGGGYANFIMEYKYNADKREDEKKKKDEQKKEEQKKQEEAEKAEKEKAAAAEAAKKKK